VLFPARDLAAVRALEAGVHALVPVDTLHGRELPAAVLLRAEGVLRSLGERLLHVVEPFAGLLGIGEGSSGRIAAEGPDGCIAGPSAPEAQRPPDAACGSGVLPGDDPEISDHVSRLRGPAAVAAAAGQEGQYEH
jgi:hypothetical protein